MITQEILLFTLVSNEEKQLHLAAAMLYGDVPINIVNQNIFVSIHERTHQLVYRYVVRDVQSALPSLSYIRLYSVLDHLQWNIVDNKSIDNRYRYIYAEKFI